MTGCHRHPGMRSWHHLGRSSAGAKQIVKVTEVACQRLDDKSVELLRNEVVGIMKNANPPKSNLTQAERDTLKTNKINKDIVIIPAL